VLARKAPGDINFGTRGRSRHQLRETAMRGFLICLAMLCASLVSAQTLQEQERLKAMDDFDRAAKAALQAFDNVGKATKRQCLIAVANEALCSCLAEKLPMKINFVQYVSIITLTKEDLGYDRLSLDDKKVVDLTRATRDQCIASVER
jgi:hypothetical protein